MQVMLIAESIVRISVICNSFPVFMAAFFRMEPPALPCTGKYSGKISPAPCNQENSLYFKVIW